MTSSNRVLVTTLYFHVSIWYRSKYNETSGPCPWYTEEMRQSCHSIKIRRHSWDSSISGSSNSLLRLVGFPFLPNHPSQSAARTSWAIKQTISSSRCSLSGLLVSCCWFRTILCKPGSGGFIWLLAPTSRFLGCHHNKHRRHSESQLLDSHYADYGFIL